MTRVVITVKMRQETKYLLYQVLDVIKQAKHDNTYNLSDLIRDSLKYYLISNLDMFPEELREKIKKHVLEPW